MRSHTTSRTRSKASCASAFPNRNSGTRLLWGTSFLVILALSYTFGAVAETPPAKTVVLTFDDAVKSHRTYVAPLLEELGFGATFFVTHLWMNDVENFMSWQDVGELHEMGFEIGNHTWTHLGLNQPAAAARLAGELALVEYELARVNVPKPVSFAWPGNAFGPEAREVLDAAGYRFARRGMQPEIAYGEIRVGPAFDPTKHDRLLIPSTGDAYPEWTLDHFKQVVEQAVEGRIVVLQFHGVPDVAHPWVHTSPERFAEYMQYLKDEGFRVIALRDVAPFVPETQVDDATVGGRHRNLSDGGMQFAPEVVATRADLEYWILNMIGRHQFTLDEAAKVAGVSSQDVQQRFATTSGIITSSSVEPYPGGRHPRTGFIEGAIAPQRGTKASVFAPWAGGGYAVVDLPEAIFSNLGLTFLAHTHIPTIWDEQNVVIENVDWERHDSGLRVTMERRLPNGIAFGSEARAVANGADLELWLRNGTDAPLTGLRTQVCVMLGALRGFEAQSNEGKIFEEPFAAAPNAKKNRWVVVGFEECGRSWGNAECPCIHADPVLPDCAPGETVRVRGYVRFHEGADVNDAFELTPLMR